MTKEMAKSLPVSKRMVYNSYLKVMEKDGGAGIDKVSIEVFNKDLSGNLYKIFARAGVPTSRRCMVLSPASPKLLHSRKILSDNLNHSP